MAKFVCTNELYEKLLVSTGLLHEDDLPFTRRVLIDLQAGHIGRVLIERFADDDQISEILKGFNPESF